MKKCYYLSTCSTCKRIMSGLDLSDFELQDIKFDTITTDQLDQMKQLSGSYESLFSRRSKQYAAIGLAGKDLSENDYKHHILNEYTFLKRPVFIIVNDIFVGSDKKTIERLTERLA